MKNYQKVLADIKAKNISKEKNLEVGFTEKERSIWNLAVEACLSVVKFGFGEKCFGDGVEIRKEREKFVIREVQLNGEIILTTKPK